jgi:hypothetical protein
MSAAYCIFLNSPPPDIVLPTQRFCPIKLETISNRFNMTSIEATRTLSLEPVT